jgi:adenylate cyclase
MPTEIERKYLVISEAWRDAAGGGRQIRQAYLSDTGRAAVRVRVGDDERAFLTIKSASPGLSRAEYEYPLPSSDARELIELRQGSVVEKTRFPVSHAGRAWEVDVYSGENDGLVVAEIELSSEGDAFERPLWLGREVTGEARYYAARLAQNPFRNWARSTQDRKP